MLCARPAAALVFVSAVALYANSLGSDFVWDDTYAVVQNPSIRDLGHVPGFFTEPWSAGTTVERGRSKNVGFYRPLTLTSFAVDHAIWGARPFGFHLTNVLLHALLAVLVFSLALRWTGDSWIALGAGLLYAAHATHTEAVDVIAYRTSSPEKISAWRLPPSSWHAKRDAVSRWAWVLIRSRWGFPRSLSI